MAEEVRDAGGAAGALPRHVGFIMDGNGRWAKKRGLTRNMGHRQGAEATTRMVRHAKKRGIRTVTVYAFSTENWSRPPEEVKGIMDQIRSFLADGEKYAEENIRMKVLGDIRGLDEDIRLRIADLEEKSADCTAMTVNIALNYGGRDEILRAVRKAAQQLAAGMIRDRDLDEAYFATLLDTAGQPDPDLIVRTSGELRTSNFLLWQSAYAEYYVTDVLWPDFKPKHLDQALADYAKRSRRHGGV